MVTRNVCDCACMRKCVRAHVRVCGWVYVGVREVCLALRLLGERLGVLGVTDLRQVAEVEARGRGRAGEGAGVGRGPGSTEHPPP